jgi:hypothetical protein
VCMSTPVSSRPCSETDADIHRRDKNGQRPIHQGAADDHVDVIQRVLENADRDGHRRGEQRDVEERAPGLEEDKTSLGSITVGRPRIRRTAVPSRNHLIRFLRSSVEGRKVRSLAAVP